MQVGNERFCRVRLTKPESSIQHELERVRRKQSKEGLVRYLEAANDAERVLVSYRRIHGHLQRLSVSAPTDLGGKH